MLIDSNPAGLQSLRTIVLLGAIALLLVSTLAPTRASAALDHYISFESRDLLLNCSGNCPTTSTKYAREGTRSMRSYVNRKTSDVSFRTEAVIPGDAKKMTFGRDYWIGFSSFLPPGWTHSGGTGIMAQIHHTPDKGENGGGPPFALRVGTGNWNVLSRGENVSTKTYTLNSAYEDVGRWVDWVVHYRPSKSSSGVLRVWKDGTLVINQTGRPTSFDNKIGPYWKMGIYLPWKDRNCCDDVPPEKIVYHDALRIASGPDARYEEVAPRGRTAVVVPPTGSDPEPEEPKTSEPQSDESNNKGCIWLCAEKRDEPWVLITEYENNQKVSGRIDIPVVAFDPDGIRKVVLWADNVIVGEDRSPPYVFSLKTGEHYGKVRIKAVAHDNKGYKARSVVRVVVD